MGYFSQLPLENLFIAWDSLDGDDLVNVVELVYPGSTPTKSNSCIILSAPCYCFE